MKTLELQNSLLSNINDNGDKNEKKTKNAKKPGGNIPGGNFPGVNSPGGSLIGGNLPVGSFLNTARNI